MTAILISRSETEVARQLFWSAPAPENMDLTPEDPLALDYLAQQVGYWLFDAFTTRTSRAQYFPVVLYGLELAGEHSAGSLAPTDAERVARFEQWERFWALAVLESRSGPLPLRSEDAFRGVRGANKAWTTRGETLSLDYPLISRQSELGGLGAYLSALRATGLVLPGSLRPSPAADEILEAFWDEQYSGTRVKAFARYARLAVSADGPIHRRHDGVTLKAVGERTRLTALAERGRVDQQVRLWTALFLNARDDTREIAELVRAASRRRVNLPSPRDFLVRAVDGSFGNMSERVREKLTFALAFGEAAQALLERFNSIYGAVSDAGWVASYNDVVRVGCTSTELRTLRRVARPLLEHPLSLKMKALPMHGHPALVLFAALQNAKPADAVRLILDYHQMVQKERQRGAGWIRTQGDQLMLSVSAYRTHRKDARFPSFKLNTVQSLLGDLGRLS